MKLQIQVSIGLALCLFCGLNACNKETTTTTPTVKDLSPYAQKFLGLNSGTMNSAATFRNGAINQSYNGAVASAQTLSGSASTGSDSSIVGPPWQTCAAVTVTNNSDGSQTVIYDYGQGCNDGYGDFKNIIHGKTIQTSQYNYQVAGTVITTTYLYRYQYINYGGRSYYLTDSTDWSQNGSSSYSGQSSYDTLNQQFTGWYNSSDTTDYAFGTDVYSYKTLGKTSYDQAKSVSDKNDYEYTSGDNYYKAVVTIPLVSDYTCNTVSILAPVNAGGPVSNIAYWFTYVSGHEVIHYRQDGKEGTFEIDYGNGDCDNKITVIENGKTIQIDLNRDWPVLAAAASHP